MKAHRIIVLLGRLFIVFSIYVLSLNLICNLHETIYFDDEGILTLSLTFTDTGNVACFSAYNTCLVLSLLNFTSMVIVWRLLAHEQSNTITYLTVYIMWAWDLYYTYYQVYELNYLLIVWGSGFCMFLVVWFKNKYSWKFFRKILTQSKNSVIVALRGCIIILSFYLVFIIGDGWDEIFNYIFWIGFCWIWFFEVSEFAIYAVCSQLQCDYPPLQHYWFLTYIFCVFLLLFLSCVSITQSVAAHILCIVIITLWCTI